MRNRKLKSQPFKVFETEEEWIAEIERIVNSVMEKVTSRLTELADAEKTKAPEAVQGENEMMPEKTSVAEPEGSVNIEKFDMKNGQMSKAEIDARLKEVRRQAEEFAKKNPKFDMEKEMENRHFCYLVFKGGVSVEDAYYIFHKDELLERQAPRISENGATKNQGISTKLNPEKFSDEDVAKILERIQDGEQISF